MGDVKTLGKGMVPRAGVESARPFGQRILSPVIAVSGSTTFTTSVQSSFDSNKTPRLWFGRFVPG